MATKAIYLLHERTTLADLVADLQVRELGLDGATGYLVGSNATLAAKVYIPSATAQLTNSTIPFINSSGRLADTILTYATGTVTQTFATAGTDNVYILSHTDNTTATSDARFEAKVGGASGGDAMFSAIITGGTTWSFGADNSASDNFLLVPTTALGTATYPWFRLSAASSLGNFEFSVDGAAFFEFGNNSAGASAAMHLALYNAGSGDSYLTFDITGASAAFGIDNSASGDPVVLAYSDTLGTTNIFSATTSEIDFAVDLDVERSSTGTVSLKCTNSNNANVAAHSLINIYVGGSSAGDPYAHFIVNGVTEYSLGIDNSDSDKFKISAAATLGTSDILTLTTAGIITVISTIVSTGGSFTGGLGIELGYNSTEGSCVVTKAGSARDFSLFNPSIELIFSVPTGTKNVLFAGSVLCAAATTSIPSLRIPHGTAPSAPTNGDMWTDTSGAYIRINGVTKSFTLT